VDGGHALTVGVEGQFGRAREAFFQFILPQVCLGRGNHQGTFGGVAHGGISIFFLIAFKDHIVT
jgi:hypothetical protein